MKPHLQIKPRFYWLKTIDFFIKSRFYVLNPSQQKLVEFYYGSVILVKLSILYSLITQSWSKIKGEDSFIKR